MTDKGIYTTQVHVAEGFIDFGIGQPQMEILPLELIREAAAHRLAQPDYGILNYGAIAGDGYFLLALADFLTRHYEMPVAAENLAIHGGVSQALDYICAHFTQPGDTIIVGEPSYFLALRVFTDHGLNIVSVPVDEHGMDMDRLEETLQQVRPTFLYTIPVFHNPMGISMSANRRERLVALAEQYDFMILADEVYHLMSFGEKPPLPLAAHIDSGRVLSLGSFAKILSPGMRIGWYHTSSAWREKLANRPVNDSGGGPNHFASTIVRSALELKLQDQYLSFLRQTYQARRDAMAEALQTHFGDTIEWKMPAGGFFIWVKFPEGVDTAVLRSQAQALDVNYQPGLAFSSTGSLRNYLRLAFSFFPENDIREGIRRLAKVIDF